MPHQYLIQTRISQPTKSPKMKTFKSVPVRALLGTMDATDQSDSDENPAMLDYSSETARSFCQEWIEDNFDLEEVNRNEIEDAIQDAVSQAIDDNVSRSMFRKVLNATADALDRSFGNANVEHEITVNEKRGTLNISVVPHNLMRAWREEVSGIGLASWGGDETIDSVTSATELVGILDRRAEVYGHPSLKSLYDDVFDRFEPDTGAYTDLAKVAETAWKKHRREKHKAGTKHRH